MNVTKYGFVKKRTKHSNALAPNCSPDKLPMFGTTYNNSMLLIGGTTTHKPMFPNLVQQI